MAFIPGQRWISNAEPELGLGTVLRVEGRGVQVLFATSGVLRQYAAQSAPLARVQFRVGQKIVGKGISFAIERVEEAKGLLTYRGDGKALAESELDDTQSISRADERLLSGRVDPPDRFDLRVETLDRRAAMRRSPAFGLASARINLIPHQLRVAETAAAMRPPRVLLADEVGLGKTIEAGMILMRLLAAGRAERILVLVPESLIHQWFVELLRRFNLQCAIYDEERCAAIEQTGDERNPFEDEQRVIVATGFLGASARRREQALAARWDVVVVDEAHHLAWTPEAASPEYLLVEQLASATPGLILLTATPEQLGRSGHFARLRLLDPARYGDLERYIAEADDYTRLSPVAEKLLSGARLSPDEHAEIGVRLIGDPEMQSMLTRLDRGGAEAARPLLDALVDRHGTGRVMFRNRRVLIGGFPQRMPEIEIGDSDDLDDNQRQRLLAEFLADAHSEPVALDAAYAADPRLVWLLGILERHPRDKLLLICRSPAKVLAIEEALRTRSGVRIARFHEGLGLVQRDRNAAYFADPEGARILLCSEIGSEGRNFQFAHRLMLWDLPLDPDLLEQRIGRLDRIGQRHAISIHAFACADTAQHVLLRWYDEGLDAFRLSPADGRELLKRYGRRLVDLATSHAHGAADPDAEIDTLIEETRTTHAELSALVNAGRDRLLELAGERHAQAQILRHALLAIDADTSADEFALRLLEHFGVENEEAAERTFVLDPERLSTGGIPGLGSERLQITFARTTALAREDLPLLHPDHPTLLAAADALIESEQGNAAFLADDALPTRSAILECVFVLECVADRRLGVERFLPALPLRIAVDTKLAAREHFAPDAAAVVRARERPVEYARYRSFLTKLVPAMLARAETLAREQAQTEITRALAAAEAELGAEHARLTALARVNPGLRQDEVDAVAAELDALRAALPKAATRLDAVRFVCSPDFLALRN